MLASLGCNDAYYTGAYAEVAASAQSGRAALLNHADAAGAVVFPCIVRELGVDGLRDATTVAVGGPLALGVRPPLERFATLLSGLVRENRIITTYVRFHPLYRNHGYAPPFFELERTEGAVAWPLTGDLWTNVHPHHRRLVRRAERAGLEVRTSSGPLVLEPFRELYVETMRRVAATQFYFFGDTYWERLAGGLADRLLLLEAEAGGVTVAAILCLTGWPWLHYHLGATSGEARGLGASHLLLYRAAQLAQDLGYEQFHLGSGVGAVGGSLLDFKRRFSTGSLVEQLLGKAVHDRERYVALTGAPDPVVGSYFPAYRRERDALD